MKQSDLNHLRRLLGWIGTKIRQEGPSAKPAGAVETYASRLLSAMRYRKIGVSTLAGATGMHYQGVKQAIEGRSKSFSAVNNMKAARFLDISPHWLATGQGAMLAPDATVPPYVVDAANALEKAIAAPGRGPGVENARAVDETSTSIGLEPGAGAGRAPDHFEERREIDSAKARSIHEEGFLLASRHSAPVAGETKLSAAAFARAVLARYGHTPPPIADAAPQPRETHAAAFSTAVDYRRMGETPQASSAMPEIGSDLINDACWKFVAAMPHKLPGPIWNDLKPALHAAICHVLAARQQPAEDVAYIARLRAALTLARDSHGVSLLTDPPQDAWKARRVDEAIRSAPDDQEGEAC